MYLFGTATIFWRKECERVGDRVEAAINLRLPAGWLDRVDAAVKHRPIKTSRHTWIMEAIWNQLQQETVEGNLDIFWENHTDQNAPPRYRLIFCRYSHFTGGAMQPVRFIGNTALVGHLIELGFTERLARSWMEKVRTEVSILIPNLMMPLEYLPRYGYGTGGGTVAPRTRSKPRD